MNVNQGKLNAARSCFAVVPHASTNHPSTARGIYVGGAGNIAVVNTDDTVVTFTAVPVGTVLYVEHKRVNASGTTATLMVGLV